MKIKGVILDFDGVVNDSFREGLRRIRNLCAISNEVRFGPKERKRLTELWGMPGVELLRQGLDISQGLAEELYREWERLDLADPVPLVPGARDALYWLRRNGFVTGLLTSRNTENIRDIFEKIDLEKEFGVITTRQESPYSKPDPRVFQHVLGEFQNRLDIQKRNCIFVGDTPADLDAGTAINIPTLLVQTGPYLLRHAKELPIELSNVLGSIEDLPLWIEEHHTGAISYPYI